MRLAAGLLLIVACEAAPAADRNARVDAAAEAQRDVFVRLRVYDDGLAELDACALDMNLMQGDAYGVHRYACDGKAALYAVGRDKLPRQVYFLDGRGAVQGPRFDLMGDESGVVRLAVRVRLGWTPPR